MSKIIKKDIDGFVMNLDLGHSGISVPLSKNPEREKAFMGLLKETVSEGMVCIDLGANIGYTTLPMIRNAGKSGFVYAIEPDPRNLKILRKNIEDNHYLLRCEVANAAISNKNGEMSFWLSQSTNLSSVKKIKSSQEEIVVDCYTLEKFLENRRYPNFIKMDVEGHEVSIFEGALNYFTNNKGNTNILLEVHPSYYDEENNFAKILEKYFEIGFSTKYVISTPVGQPKLFKKAGYSPIEIIETDRVFRGIYDNVKDEDVIKFACYENEEKHPTKPKNSKKIVRSFMIERE